MMASCIQTLVYSILNYKSIMGFTWSSTYILRPKQLILAEGATNIDLGLHYLDFFTCRGEIQTFANSMQLTTTLGARGNA